MRWLCGVLAAVLAGCRPAAAPRIEGGWSYQVQVSEQATELRVEAFFGKGSPAELSVASGAEPYIREVSVEEGGGWARVEPRGTSWFVPACREVGCRVRYRFALREAAALATTERVSEIAGGFLTMPAAWLLRPLFAVGEAPVSLRFASAPGVAAVTGFAASVGEGSFVATVDDIPQPPFVGFGAFRTSRLRVAGGEIEVAIAPGAWSLGDDQILAWVEANAGRAASLVGGASLPRYLVMVVPSEGAGIDGGLTLGNGGASVVMWLGEQTQAAFLKTDWVLLHEVLHVAFPGMPPAQHWMEEGLSTYMEPLVRAREGMLSERDAWAVLCDAVAEEEQGPLDGAQGWARVYRGGALFYLALTAEAAERGGGGPVEVMKAVRGAGGSVARRWGVSELRAVADGATRGAWSKLYDGVGSGRQRLSRGPLLERLGVRCGAGGVELFEGPQAAARRALTAR